jgi:hypothetical protein
MQEREDIGETHLRHELKHAVQVPRVGHVVGDDWCEERSVISEVAALQHPTTSVHPILVTAQCVNFAVVTQDSVGLRPIPRGECVRTEP